MFLTLCRGVNIQYHQTFNWRTRLLISGAILGYRGGNYADYILHHEHFMLKKCVDDDHMLTLVLHQQGVAILQGTNSVTRSVYCTSWSNCQGVLSWRGESSVEVLAYSWVCRGNSHLLEKGEIIIRTPEIWCFVLTLETTQVCSAS
jgi:hypothetical protein